MTNTTEILATTRQPGAFERFWKRWQLGVPTLVLLLILFLVVVVALNGEPDFTEATVINAPYITNMLVRHFLLSLTAALIVAAIAIPAGILLTRLNSSSVTGFVMGLGNIGQAFPPLGVLIILALLVGIGPGPAIAGLVVYSLLPVLRNTVVGLEQVDRNLIEAAKGMGMRSFEVLRKVELPLALPIVIAGFRTALVFSVGVATLSTFINSGGLGDAIVIGVKLNRPVVLLVGALLAAALALILDWAVGVAEEELKPVGLKVDR